MGPDQDVVISCTRCTINVPIAQTTYENNSKNLICFECYNKIAKGIQPDFVVQKAEVPDKINYRCLACNYVFSRSKNFSFGGHCFNCGKVKVQVENARQPILKDRKNLLDY